ncbi:hypothetical protein [Pseudarthrobacter sp. NamE5]|uniref:hypothetical protein n=1 Tax=Pseudarthrobacter sp. NamE5 TaxID=2576839 RepID=UPI00110B5D3F|nr:hypothetical protein [Pseudarthrobacter sp. NamE5]TLM80796.1 hypothetical protein FDW84_18255 [Pseudarthrobacter sp. NamE5]
MSQVPDSGVAPKNTHYLLVALLAAGGLLVGVAAYFVSRLVPDMGDDDLAVTQSILTNLGIGFFSAAVLFLLEPKFRRAVKADVTDTVTDTVRTATEGLKDEVREAVQEDFEDRFATLADRINARYDAKLKEQSDLVSDLSSDFTHERVSKLFEEAATLRALHENALLVEADDEIGNLRVRFSWHHPHGTPWTDPSTLRPPGDDWNEVHIAAWPSTGDWWASPEVAWTPNMTFEDVALELAVGLNSSGSRGLAERIQWGPILQRFETAVKAAIESRMKTEGAPPLEGGLSEFLDHENTWYLTNRGLYCPTHNSAQLLADFEEIPDQPPWAGRREWFFIASRAQNLRASALDRR